MTPVERARLIEKQEFEAECRAIREHALRYAEARRQEDAARLAKCIGKEPTQPKPKVMPTDSKPKRYTHNDVSKSLSEWATEYNLDYRTLQARLRSGIPFAEAVTMKRGARARSHTVNGITKTLQEWADHIGISYDALTQRLRRHTLAEAIAMPAGRWPRRTNPKSATVADLPSADEAPGEVSNFGASAGTGAGSTAQEIPEITFSEQAENA